MPKEPQDPERMESSVSRRQFIRTASALAGASAVFPLLDHAAPAFAAPLEMARQATPKNGGILKAAIIAEPDTLDPAISTIYPTWEVIWNIFSTLVRIEANGQFTGVLAKSWSQPDPKTYVFNLRNDVYFHNGEKFTAHDVKYSIERILNPKTGSFAKQLFSPVTRVQVTSPTRIVFHLSAPFGPFLTNLGQHLQIVNQKAIESSNPARNPIGTGPFKFVNWVSGNSLTIARNPDYFAHRPYLDQVVFSFIPTNESRVLGLTSGALDWLDGVPLQNLKALKSDPSFTFVGSKAVGIPDELRFQCAKPPFNNKAVRQAVAWAINLKAVDEVAFFGTGEIGDEEVGSGSPWWTRGANPYVGGSIKKAKALMAKAGYHDGFTTEILCIPTYPTYGAVAQVIQPSLKAIGINMKILELETAEWLARYSKGNFQMLSGSYSGICDPDVFWTYETAPGNWNHYSNPHVTALVEKARGETHLASRRALYGQIRKLVIADAPVIFTHYETIQYLMAKNVVGSQVYLDESLRFEYVGFRG